MNFARQSPVGYSSFIQGLKHPNVIDGNGDFSATSMATHPADKITMGKFTFVLDSRQRDCTVFPSPNFFQIKMGDVYKNISSIELKAAILPKSSYNIHSSNKYIDFVIGDTVTAINITNSGSGYTVVPTVTIAPPVAGVTATATAIINAQGEISGFTITTPGTGYSASSPPIITISAPDQTYGTQATVTAVVGTHYSASLREGNYVLGGNPTPPATLPSDLLLEIQNAMNFAVNGGAYNPTSVTPFVVRVVNQYPELNATAGTPEAFDTNASLFNRIQITNVNSDPWEILWCSGPNHTRSLRRVMGFPWQNSTNSTATAVVTAAAGTLIPAGTTIRASFDYDLIDDPEYVVLSFWAMAEESFERVDSSTEGGLDRAFATLIFDANTPNNVMDPGGTIETIGGTRYLIGDLGMGTFFRTPGQTKALKGTDFDKKYLEFSPSLGKLGSLNVQFTKYGQVEGQQPELYDFQGRDLLLIFEFTSGGDQKGEVDA